MGSRLNVISTKCCQFSNEDDDIMISGCCEAVGHKLYESEAFVVLIKAISMRS